MENLELQEFPFDIQVGFVIDWLIGLFIYWSIDWSIQRLNDITV